ncbi:alpha/beta fold hydrolase [Nocardia yamanashiensis]|uniref:thioesterase II family protein n=1 Tax=Nocardia yamanashiensis TaxID=209247 RepID=UPI001E465C63|nr:alpha/beta fold hydrolase [Nocardia yamanashiensis]UGT42567.1 alpha/beta fold hydrolase [Nocardia yamanashiensis]
MNFRPRYDTRRLSAGLTCVRPRPDAVLRLVCFAHAGGGPQVFRHWADFLGLEMEVWTVALPGRGRWLRDQPITAWKPLVEGTSQVIAREIPGSIALFGHSFGALLAFEVARSMTTAGIEPAQLVVSGRPAPSAPFAVALLADDLTLMSLMDARYGGVPEQIRGVPELVEHFGPLLRSDLELVVNYDYRRDPVLSCSIAAFAGTEDPDTTADNLADWGRETIGDFVSRRFPGGHFYLTEHTPEVLETLRELLMAKVGDCDARAL